MTTTPTPGPRGQDETASGPTDELARLRADLEQCRRERDVLSDAAQNLLSCMGNPNRGQLVYDHDQAEGCMDSLRAALNPEPASARRE